MNRLHKRTHLALFVLTCAVIGLAVGRIPGFNQFLSVAAQGRTTTKAKAQTQTSANDANISVAGKPKAAAKTAVSCIVNGTTGSGSPDKAGTSGAQNGRIFRDAIPSACPSKVYPGIFNAGTTYNYDAYTFTNATNAAVCITVNFDPDSVQGACGTNAHASAYLTSYDPDNQGTNYVGDVGSSLAQPFSFEVPANTDFVIVVTNTSAQASCNYQFEVLDTACVAVPPFTPAPTMSIVDPLACVGQGDLVNGSFGITNTSAVDQAGTMTTTLPAEIVGVAGSCVASVGTCTITATTITWTGTLTPGQVLSATYQAHMANGAASGTTACATMNAVFGANTASLQACMTLNCPQAGPGLLPSGLNAVSDQKPGSVLVYPIYSSSAANASTQNTRISITNTSTTRNALVHLFFVDGSSCSVADSYICLTPNQTAAILASDVDPGTTGYLVAVAVDIAGCPISFNHLIGDEYVKLATGHQSNLGAESIAAIAGATTACNAQTSNSAVLAFDNVSYNALPRVLASSNIPSRGDGNDTYVVINRLGGSLMTGASGIGGFFGILYDDSEAAYSFSLAASACQSAGSITNDRPRTVPRIETVIPSGRSGWFKIWGASDVGILGAQINRNNNAGTNASAFNHGHNLHKLTYTTTATVTIPVFPPSC